VVERAVGRGRPLTGDRGWKALSPLVGKCLAAHNRFEVWRDRLVAVDRERGGQAAAVKYHPITSTSSTITGAYRTTSSVSASASPRPVLGCAAMATRWYSL
jgi:hypothetical protein